MSDMIRIPNEPTMTVPEMIEHLTNTYNRLLAIERAANDLYNATIPKSGGLPLEEAQRRYLAVKFTKDGDPEAARMVAG